MKYGVTRESAKKWANKMLEQYKLTDEYKEEKKILQREFIDHSVLVKPLYWLDGQVVQDLLKWPKTALFTEEMTLDEIIEKWNPSEDTIAKIKNIQDGKSIYKP